MAVSVELRTQILLLQMMKPPMACLVILTFLQKDEIPQIVETGSRSRGSHLHKNQRSHHLVGRIHEQAIISVKWRLWSVTQVMPTVMTW